MKRINVIYGILFLLVILSCESKKVDQDKNIVARSADSLGFSPLMVSIVDSFIVNIKRYSYSESGDSIHLIGYLCVEESSENQKFKIRIEGIHHFTTELDKIKADDYFVRSGVFFLVNYNVSDIASVGKDFNLSKVISKSNINQYQAADTKMPSWLIEINDGIVSKVYKKADSYFERKQDIVGYFTESGIVNYRLTEWGEVLDDNGNVFDSLDDASYHRW
ncbi:MAG: hypothetical protein A3D31_08030 [Candidatus Fluviicola riflensis]|nr:MAG: hypothetical protein CHH17_06980 [Candidatus Fluviicola riflensis]OGS79889.1 MAG: hypothetical protein A3D31_08030 [Candidatus Fluviicola riflensis]OGS82404.1 MAG: hypothetical protein A2724_16975 [Fluviicola sp. RIFCSPHIGHO2_01_FULL_43_53]OGS88068.1 MAG: hypothetical protein A3E30_14410 [Fluviicola sp. RIFCSPHIGHO2_12_FULL_43_24]